MSIPPSVRICTPNGKSYEATKSHGGDPITFDDLPLSSLLDLNSLSNRNYKPVSSFIWLVTATIAVMGKLVSETVLRDALLPSRQVQGLFFRKGTAPRNRDLEFDELDSANQRPWGEGFGLLG
jgi:hypothetical protein